VICAGGIRNGTWRDVAGLASGTTQRLDRSAARVLASRPALERWAKKQVDLLQKEKAGYVDLIAAANWLDRHQFAIGNLPICSMGGNGISTSLLTKMARKVDRFLMCSAGELKPEDHEDISDDRFSGEFEAVRDLLVFELGTFEASRDGGASGLRRRAVDAIKRAWKKDPVCTVEEVEIGEVGSDEIVRNVLVVRRP
jgi:hypothetical protein